MIYPPTRGLSCSLVPFKPERKQGRVRVPVLLGESDHGQDDAQQGQNYANNKDNPIHLVGFVVEGLRVLRLCRVVPDGAGIPDLAHVRVEGRRPDLVVDPVDPVRITAWNRSGRTVVATRPLFLREAAARVLYSVFPPCLPPSGAEESRIWASERFMPQRCAFDSTLERIVGPWCAGSAMGGGRGASVEVAEGRGQGARMGGRLTFGAFVCALPIRSSGQ